jgi:hypothetical protein
MSAKLGIGKNPDLECLRTLLRRIQYKIFSPEVQTSETSKQRNTEGRFGIVVPKATTAVSNFLTTCAVVDGS